LLHGLLLSKDENPCRGLFKAISLPDRVPFLLVKCSLF
jgi:hypothetical protein